jgi:release factor glutamine methyltransferase
MADPLPTVAALVGRATERLTASGSASPRLDAELLLGQALGTDRVGILAHPAAPVGEGPRAAFEAATARRERGEPVAYIRGFREFHGLALATDPRALIPRPETEMLVDAAIEAVAARLVGAPPPDEAPRCVADVGTGSGAIAVALLVALRRRRMAAHVRVDAIDVSEDALALARENAVAHGVADRMSFAVGDLLPAWATPPYAVVCANLPYVATGDLDGLAPDLAYEPRGALDGGPDGLDLVRRLLERLPGTLAPDGVALLEIGAEQGELIVREVAARLPGWGCVVMADLGGLPRLARIEPPRVGRRPGAPCAVGAHVGGAGPSTAPACAPRAQNPAQPGRPRGFCAPPAHFSPDSARLAPIGICICTTGPECARGAQTRARCAHAAHWIPGVAMDHGPAASRAREGFVAAAGRR